MASLFGFIDFLSPPTILIVGILAILLYGEKLPEVARTFGKQFLEFKKSLQGIREEFESATREITSTVDRSVRSEDVSYREEATTPKFEPPPGEAYAEAPAGPAYHDPATEGAEAKHS
jgi:sec-independent protein translocase protein TatA